MASFVIAAGENTYLPINRKLTADGRACSGYFIMHTHTLSWKSTWQRCTNVPYECTKREKVERNGYQFDRFIYTVSVTPGTCPYRVIAVDHQIDNLDTGWEILGYTSETKWKNKDSDLDCQMY